MMMDIGLKEEDKSEVQKVSQHHRLRNSWDTSLTTTPADLLGEVHGSYSLFACVAGALFRRVQVPNI